MDSLAVILLNYNGSEDTIECIQSLDKSVTDYTYNIYIVDNDSRSTEKNVLKDYIKNKIDFEVCDYNMFRKEKIRGNILILSNENLGFARGNNIVIREIYKEYSYILLLNNDTVVKEDFIEQMLNLMDNDKNIGFASCRIDNYYDHDLLWNCGGVLRPWGLRKYYSEKDLDKMPYIISAEFITGCAMFIRSETIEKHGALSDDFFHGEEDFNFCWRMKKDHVIGKCINKTLVYHKVNATSKKSGNQPGKMAGYYAYRIVDMKQFYPRAIWYTWKTLLVKVLKVRWRRLGYTKTDIAKMLNIVKRTSKLDSINREETFKIWNLNY